MSASLADYYNGRSATREYSSFLALVYENGVRVAYTAKHLVQTFTFIGVPESLAFAEYDSLSVADITGTTHSIAVKSYLSETSGGYAPFIHVQIEVDRQRMSPHLWNVSVTRTCSEMYRNGVLQTDLGVITAW